MIQISGLASASKNRSGSVSLASPWWTMKLTWLSSPPRRIQAKRPNSSSPWNGLGDGPLGHLGWVDRVAPQVQAPEVVEVAGRVVAVVAGGSVVVDDRRSRSRRTSAAPRAPTTAATLSDEIAPDMLSAIALNSSVVPAGDSRHVVEHAVRARCRRCRSARTAPPSTDTANVTSV